MRRRVEAEQLGRQLREAEAAFCAGIVLAQHNLLRAQVGQQQSFAHAQRRLYGID
jgi:hypothetical protein